MLKSILKKFGDVSQGLDDYMMSSGSNLDEDEDEDIGEDEDEDLDEDNSVE